MKRLGANTLRCGSRCDRPTRKTTNEVSVGNHKGCSVYQPSGETGGDNIKGQKRTKEILKAGKQLSPRVRRKGGVPNGFRGEARLIGAEEP